MKYSADQVVNGIINYADNEIMAKLPTSGKWIVGTAIGLASNKATHMIDSLKDNMVVKALDVIDDDGMIDVDALISAMRSSADRYGKLTVEVPMIGRLSFTASDVDSLRSYIN